MLVISKVLGIFSVWLLFLFFFLFQDFYVLQITGLPTPRWLGSCRPQRCSHFVGNMLFLTAENGFVVVTKRLCACSLHHNLVTLTKLYWFWLNFLIVWIVLITGILWNQLLPHWFSLISCFIICNIGSRREQIRQKELKIIAIR